MDPAEAPALKSYIKRPLHELMRHLDELDAECAKRLADYQASCTHREIVAAAVAAQVGIPAVEHQAVVDAVDLAMPPMSTSAA